MRQTHGWTQYTSNIYNFSFRGSPVIHLKVVFGSLQKYCNNDLSPPEPIPRNKTTRNEFYFSQNTGKLSFSKNTRRQEQQQGQTHQRVCLVSKTRNLYQQNQSTLFRDRIQRTTWSSVWELESPITPPTAHRCHLVDQHDGVNVQQCVKKSTGRFTRKQVVGLLSLIVAHTKEMKEKKRNGKDKRNNDSSDRIIHRAQSNKHQRTSRHWTK